MRENYNNLCIFNFGKRCYVVMKNNDKVLYFESVDGKYVMPITSFNLYDNEGKSLTVVNQHFFMNQLINRINIALSKGYFSDDKELIDYLHDIKDNIENDISLKKIFKGSLMKEIDEDNFEINKKELLKYLDKFKIDSFTPYNNVSIFNGSLEKVSSDNTVSLDSVQSDKSLDLEDKDKSEPVNTFSLNIVFNGISSSDNASNSGSLDNVKIDNNSTNDEFNFTDINKFNIEDSSEFINSNDYFSNMHSDTSGVDQNNVINENSVQVNPVSTDNTNLNNNINQFSGDLSNNVSGNENNNQINTIDNIVSNDDINQFSGDLSNNVSSSEISTQSNEYNSILDSIGIDGNSEKTNPNILENVVPEIDVLNLNNAANNVQVPNLDDVTSLGSSYIDQVKNRIQNSSVSTSGSINNVNQMKYGNEMGEVSSFEPNVNVNLNNEVITDKNELPELESISNDEVNVSDNKKSKAGFIVIMIIVLLLLGFISYYLYRYVF